MNGRHRSIFTFVSIVAILSFFLMSPGLPVRAQQSATVTISDFVLQTVDGKEAKDPLMAGASYKISFALQIPKGVSDQIILKTDLKLITSTGRYWDLDAAYFKERLQNINPAREQISFQSDEGKPKFVLYGEVPDVSVSPKELPGQVFHLKKNVNLLLLSSASGTIKDQRAIAAIDKSIEVYQNTFAAKKAVVETLDLDPFLLGIVAVIVKQAGDLAAAGNTDSATKILNAIPDKGWPQPPTSNTLLYFVIGVVAVIAVLFAFLMIKSRGAAGYAKNVIEDQVKKLDVVSVKAGRLGDKGLVSEINSVKDELDRISR